MKHVILIVFAVTLQSLPAASAGGGTTIVGDGGLVVKCPGREAMLFDLYEEGLVFKEARRLTLHQNGQSLPEMVNTGLERIRKKFNLSKHDKQKMRSLFHDFYAKPFNPWEHSTILMKYSEYLEVNPVITPSFVHENLVQTGCKIKTAVINPNIQRVPTVTKRIYSKICSYGYDKISNCLFQNTDILRELSDEQTACLFVHEALRFLPKAALPRDEFQLRRMTAAVCTE